MLQTILHDHRSTAFGIKEHSNYKVALTSLETILSLLLMRKLRPRVIKWHAKAKKLEDGRLRTMQVCGSLAGLSRVAHMSTFFCLRFPDAQTEEERLFHLCSLWMRQNQVRSFPTSALLPTPSLLSLCI